MCEKICEICEKIYEIREITKKFLWDSFCHLTKASTTKKWAPTPKIWAIVKIRWATIPESENLYLNGQLSNIGGQCQKVAPIWAKKLATVKMWWAITFKKLALPGEKWAIDIFWWVYLIFGHSYQRCWQEDSGILSHIPGSWTHTGAAADYIGPLFDKAERNATATAYLKLSPTARENLRKKKSSDFHNQIFLHLQYHPYDPQSHKIQQIWREQVLQPAGETELTVLESLNGERVGINKLVVAYNRPPNLKNRFSVRDIHCRGKSVSEHLAQWSYIIIFKELRMVIKRVWT